MEASNLFNVNDGKNNSSSVDGSGKNEDGNVSGGNGHKDSDDSNNIKGKGICDDGNNTGDEGKENGGHGNGSDNDKGHDNADKHSDGKDKDGELGESSSHGKLDHSDCYGGAHDYSDDSNKAYALDPITFDDDMSDGYNDGDNDNSNDTEDGDYNDGDDDDYNDGDDDDYNDGDDYDYNDGDDDDCNDGDDDDYIDGDDDDYNVGDDDDCNDSDDVDYDDGHDEEYNDSDNDDYNDRYDHDYYNEIDNDYHDGSSDDQLTDHNDSDNDDYNDRYDHDYYNEIDNDYHDGSSDDQLTDHEDITSIENDNYENDNDDAMEFNDHDDDSDSNDSDDNTIGYDEDYNIGDMDITGDYNSHEENSKKKDDGVCDKKRKIRWCPKLHLGHAKSLTTPSNEIIVVGNYRYSNEHIIGSGASSNTFVAIKDENVDNESETIECRAYALKRLDKAKINRKEIRREITTLLSLSSQCENIIKCHEINHDNFFHYISLELMDGDLHKFVDGVDENSRLIEDAAWPVKYCEQIINGIAFLHQQKYIHRDIKPGNILYITDPSLQFKIADFGLSKNVSSSSTMTSTRESNGNGVPGTRCWLAPELVSMVSTEHTQESDIFSLGLVLHYLLTLGKHPFANPCEVNRPHVIEQNIENMQLNLDKSLHPEAANFFKLILVKDSSKRSRASDLNRHPFLWIESKKIEFLKAVGDQQVAEKPNKHSDSDLEENLRATTTGKEISKTPWDTAIEELYKEISNSWKRKTYRTDNIIDLVRFIRNAYAHRQDKSDSLQEDLESNIFLRKFPSLVLDTFGVVQKLGFHETRNNIRQALDS